MLGLNQRLLSLKRVGDLVRPKKGLLALGVLMISVNRAAGLAIPFLSKAFINDVMTNHVKGRLTVIIAAVLVATAIQILTAFLNTHLLAKEALRIVAELRTRLQRHVGRLSLTFHDAHQTGALVTRIMSDVDGVRTLLGSGLIELLGSGITAGIAFVFLLHRDYKFTLLVFAVIACFGGIVYWCLDATRPILRTRALLNETITGRLTESLIGTRVIKGFHAEEQEAEVFSRGVTRLFENVIRTLTTLNLLAVVSSSSLGIVGGLVMYLSGRSAISGRMTPAEYVQYTMFLAFLVTPVIQLVNFGMQLSETIAGIQRTADLLAIPEEFTDDAQTTGSASSHGAVAFENVSFEYVPGKPVLKAISFAAENGSVTALVGSSGSGKSTITNLICGFYLPTRGRITVNGVSLSDLNLSEYRSRLGVVLQESFLFDGTIRENVVFPRPAATESQFLEACRLACVDEFALSLPEQYGTRVGERGLKLSGGQRQRLAIARAILADPQILILDEATSSLDSESEFLIQQGLDQLTRGRTTFIIAHRISTILRADRILVIEKGEIVESGSHSGLLSQGGRYYELYRRQYGVESNLFLSPGEGGET